jgi:hypothetical protein
MFAPTSTMSATPFDAPTEARIRETVEGLDEMQAVELETCDAHKRTHNYSRGYTQPSVRKKCCPLMPSSCNPAHPCVCACVRVCMRACMHACIVHVCLSVIEQIVGGGVSAEEAWVES